MLKKTSLLLIIFVFSGCASQGIVKLSQDTYLIAKTDRAGIFGNASKLKIRTIQEANDFAASQGKVAVPITSTETPMGPAPGQFARFEYQFRVVDESDLENQRVALKRDPDFIMEDNKNIDVNVKDSDDSVDIYNELIKLNDLREKGILTDAEFQSEKTKLLEK